MERLIIVRNDNFSEHGRIKEALYRDNIHPNNSGTLVLAGNLKRILSMFKNSEMSRLNQRLGNRRGIQGQSFYIPPERPRPLFAPPIHYQGSRPQNYSVKRPQQQNYGGQERMASDLASAIIQIMNRK